MLYRKSEIPPLMHFAGGSRYIVRILLNDIALFLTTASITNRFRKTDVLWKYEHLDWLKFRLLQKRDHSRTGSLRSSHSTQTSPRTSSTQHRHTVSMHPLVITLQKLLFDENSVFGQTVRLCFIVAQNRLRCVYRKSSRLTCNPLASTLLKFIIVC